ncbi:MAG: HAMP domain-containing histidine kinase [Ruminococcaceae bacterium]|nr:HAMP domain-containing histidine kinase [Oscillospiraceae bacterium]
MRKKTRKAGSSLRLTMIVLVLVFICISVLLALALYALIEYIVSLFDISLRPDAYSIWIPLIGLAVSIIMGTVLSILIGIWFLRPLSELMTATRMIADGDFTVRVPERKNQWEIGEFVRGFNKMAEELNSLEILRTDFVNTFSHEFKTPIISIRGFARLLQSEHLTAEQRRTYTDTIIRESERLAAMSTNILLLTQYENTEIVSGKEEYALDEQIRQCIHLQERAWLEKEITLDGELEPVRYYGNEELISHIWSNLIANAIRFTPAGGTISVTLRRGAEGVEVTVADSGIGMEEETLQRIYDKFYKADTAGQSAGNGLGLAIVRRAVQLCGGTIAVQSRPGEGTTFTVCLPEQTM